MSLLVDILNAATDEKVTVSALLMKCRLLAHRLGHEEFKQWVFLESNGYSEDASVPPYREINVALKANIHLPGKGILKGYSIPVDCFSKEDNTLVDKSLYMLQCREEVASLENVLAHKSKNPLSRHMGKHSAWVGRLMRKGGAFRIRENAEILELWQEFSSGQIAGVCNAVRCRIIDFSAEIQKDLPNAGELSGDSLALDDRKGVVNQVFHNTFYKGGSMNMVGTAIDSTVINITAGDFGGLSKALADNGFSQENINLLRDALDADKDGKSSDGFGPKVSEWLSKMTAKVANRSLDVSVDFLIKAITQYYGGA